jgi:hypothetical protein
MKIIGHSSKVFGKLYKCNNQLFRGFDPTKEERLYNSNDSSSYFYTLININKDESILISINNLNNDFEYIKEEKIPTIYELYYIYYKNKGWSDQKIKNYSHMKYLEKKGNKFDFLIKGTQNAEKM